MLRLYTPYIVSVLVGLALANLIDWLRFRREQNRNY
jgi:hypothetical protein